MSTYYIHPSKEHKAHIIYRKTERIGAKFAVVCWLWLLFPVAIWLKLTDNLPIGVFLFCDNLDDAPTMEDAIEKVYTFQSQEQKLDSLNFFGTKGIYIK